MHISCPPRVLQDPPISLSFIQSICQCKLKSKNYEAPHSVLFSAVL